MPSGQPNSDEDMRLIEDVAYHFANLDVYVLAWVWQSDEFFRVYDISFNS